MQLAPRFFGDDTQLNMTPMIDIVFQLILFFLFSLRFKSIDWRIESQLPDRVGTGVGPSPDLPTLRVGLSRLDPELPDRARTQVRVGGDTFVLADRPSPDRADRERILAQITERLRALYAATGLPGAIEAKPPRGGLVPHEDVVAMLDAFIEAGVPEVMFEGTASPMPRR